MRRAMRGDPRAGEALFSRYWPLARRAALAITADHHLADEVAQDAFETMLRRLDEFRGESTLSTWLVQVVVNRAKNVVRTEGRSTPMAEPREQLVADQEPPSLRDPELVDAVRGLAPERRVAVVLRYWLDMGPQEIATALEIPVGTVYSRLARALEDLRAQLEVSYDRA